MKKLSLIVGIVVLSLFAVTAQAGQLLESRGLGIAADLRNPAVSALEDGWYVTIFSLEAVGNVSEVLDAYQMGKDISKFRDAMQQRDYTQLESRKEELRDIFSRANHSLDLRTRADVASLSVGNKKYGKFFLGAYGEGQASVRTAPPKEKQLNVVRDGTSGYLDIGEDTNFLKFRAYGDAGGLAGYGLSFDLPKKMQISGGIMTRVYNRWYIDDYRVTIKRQLRSENDVQLPDNISFQSGLNAAIDSAVAFAPNDKYVGVRVVAAVENIPAYQTVDMPGNDGMKYVLGASIFPFHALDWDNMVIATEAAYKDGPSLQTGIAVRLGAKMLNLTPRAGLVIHERNLYGETSDLFVCGLGVKLAILSLAGAYELGLDGDYWNAGGKVGIDF